MLEAAIEDFVTKHRVVSTDLIVWFLKNEVLHFGLHALEFVIDGIHLVTPGEDEFL